MVPWASYVDLWGLFLENGSAYDKDQILTNDLFDQSRYDTYGPLRIGSFILTYSADFATLPSTLVILYTGQELLQRSRSAHRRTDDDDDIHRRHMLSYPEVPNL
ncbi:hypothetical protein BGZ74_011400 [Mortierella antarctica]|nr:hypothetical protein BGZ74_011400 [Mortierella antarctica]